MAEEKVTGPLPRTYRVSVAMTLWLAVVWVLVFGSAEPMILVSGILLALLVQWIFPLPHITHTWRVRPLAFIVLVARFLWDLLVAGVQVSWVVLRGRCENNGRVQVVLRSGDPVHMTIVSAMTSLVPGSVVLDVDVPERRLDLHILDLDAHGGKEGVIASVHAQEQRLLAAIAPRMLAKAEESQRLRRGGESEDSQGVGDSQRGRA